MGKENDGSSLIRAKQDSRSPKNGRANGWYSCTCRDCGAYFTGDKRATQCADCAYKETAAALEELKPCSEPTAPVMYGVRQKQKDGSYLWLSGETGQFVKDEAESGIWTWPDRKGALGVLYMLHAADARNAEVAIYPSTEPQRVETIDLTPIDRFEVIDETGRVYVSGSIYGDPVQVKFDVQDGGRTLKVFVKGR